MHILLSDPAFTPGFSLATKLRQAGHTVEVIEDLREAIQYVSLYDYDLFLLDLTLPDLTALEVIHQLRTQRHAIPILVLSDLTKISTKVRAFSLGADDYLTTPFHIEELLARIQALVRRSKGIVQSSITIGTFHIDLGLGKVQVQGESLHLTRKEYDILEKLVLRRGAVISREALLSHLYCGMDTPEPKIIDVFVCKLRKKLVQAGAPNLIITVWGRGHTILSESDQNHMAQLQ